MSITDEPLTAPEPDDINRAPFGTPVEWRTANDGRLFVPAVGRAGIVFRRGDTETVAEAYARDAAKVAEKGAPSVGGRPTQGAGKKRPDPRPNVKPPKDGVKLPTSVGDPELVAMLAQLLSMPAIPAKMVLDCDYCAHHFASQGPQTAIELVKLSKDHPDLRKMLERWYFAFDSFTWGSVLVTYAIKPVLHHLAPAPVLAGVGPLMGIPPRGTPAPHQHTQRAESPAEQWAREHTPPPPPIPTMPPDGPDEFMRAAGMTRRTMPQQPRRRTASNRADDQTQTAPESNGTVSAEVPVPPPVATADGDTDAPAV